ncbi:MAG: polyhydroxyalkanoate synthesis protein PhaF [Actinomycetales bacterium]|nr:polyhydroxyalkanoate synthesis protein PhaF [Actinomycetales bacterium]MCP4894431.1 polyhydroxyalkanoate synthesis protein PhaF [Actinomycetales bacterium]
MMDALKGYVQLATGLTEVTAAKARDAASALVNQGMQWTGKSSDAMESVQDIADDLLVTSQQNREALMEMIRTEVDRAVGRLGFVREDELAALRARVERLESGAEAPSTAPDAPSAGGDETPAPAPKVKKKVVPE